MPRVFVSDCEGPYSKNDNAFELAQLYVENGGPFFSLVSRYDDYLADVVKKSGYKAGDTLKLILPFLKAFGATNKGIEEYSAGHILLVPGAKDTIQFVKKKMPSFIVSTSYEQYIRALCGIVDFPFENAYCTRLDIDKYEIGSSETGELKKLAQEISIMPELEIPSNATSIEDFSQRDKETVKRLDEIFWEKIPGMGSGRMLEEVNPVGGFEKANAVKEILERTGAGRKDLMYVGDSITDVQAFQLVLGEEGWGGLTVSFNGNGYAVREAEVAVLSNNTIVTSVLADVFNRRGADGAIDFVVDWSKDAFYKYEIDEELRRRMFEIFPENLPHVELITEENRERLSKESSAFRKTVRGEDIGKLG